ncbi:MAG: hypothetical protein ACTSRP_02465 [Candidatus Helarchaeota archaeon]
MSAFNISDFMLNMLITALGRALDLLSTYRVTPKFKLETNRLMSRFGWWGAILVQIPIIILGGFAFQIALFIFTWSIFITANNLSGTWFIKGLKEGENTYSELLKESAKNAKWYNILLDESAPLLLFTIPNIIIWILIIQLEGDILFLFTFDSIYSYILIITGAAILHGIVATCRNFIYIIRLRSAVEKLQKETNKKSEILFNNDNLE